MFDGVWNREYGAPNRQQMFVVPVVPPLCTFINIKQWTGIVTSNNLSPSQIARLLHVPISDGKCLYRVLYYPCRTLLTCLSTVLVAGCGLRNASYLWYTLLTCYGFCGILWSLARQCKWANCLQSCVSLVTNCLTSHCSYELLTWVAVSALGHGAHVPRVKL